MVLPRNPSAPILTSCCGASCVVLHRNAVTVCRRTHVGKLKSGHSRAVALVPFVVEEPAATCEGKRGTI